MNEPKVAIRAVTPWQWRRALRDHWPGDRGALLTLYTMSTYMDGKVGITFVKQSTLAEKTGAVDRTIRRHLERAVALGFLGTWCSRSRDGGQGWRRTYYQAHVPMTLELGDEDEKLANTVGSIDDNALRVEPPVVKEQPFAQRTAEAPSKGLADGTTSAVPSATGSSGERHQSAIADGIPGAFREGSTCGHLEPTCGHQEPKVRTFGAEGADTRDMDTSRVEGPDTQTPHSPSEQHENKALVTSKGPDTIAPERADNPPPKFLGEVVIEVVSNEARSHAPRVSVPMPKTKEPASETERKVQELMRAQPDMSDQTLERIYGITRNRISELRWQLTPGAST